MLVIGLTGGIASGKTAVANQFAELGIDVIDTDIIAREVVAADTAAYQAIAQHFGNEILLDNQQINRKKLREIVFADPTEKTWLEALLHPQIRAQTQQKIAQAHSPYCVVVIPLLFETSPNPLIQRVLVIDCDENLQLKRAMNRDQIDSPLAKTILTNQASREQRLSIADDIIENNGSLEDLHKNVLKLHNFYLTLSGSTN